MIGVGVRLFDYTSKTLELLFNNPENFIQIAQNYIDGYNKASEALNESSNIQLNNSADAFVSYVRLKTLAEESKKDPEFWKKIGIGNKERSELIEHAKNKVSETLNYASNNRPLTYSPFTCS